MAGYRWSNIDISVLDFLEVCIVKYRIFLTIKNALDFPNYIIMLLKLKGKYRDDTCSSYRYIDNT